jgi:hypothetical protein
VVFVIMDYSLTQSYEMHVEYLINFYHLIWSANGKKCNFIGLPINVSIKK